MNGRRGILKLPVLRNKDVRASIGEQRNDVVVPNCVREVRATGRGHFGSLAEGSMIAPLALLLLTDES